MIAIQEDIEYKTLCKKYTVISRWFKPVTYEFKLNTLRSLSYEEGIELISDTIVTDLLYRLRFIAAWQCAKIIEQNRKNII